MRCVFVRGIKSVCALYPMDLLQCACTLTLAELPFQSAWFPSPWTGALDARPGQVCSWRMPATLVVGTGRAECWELMGGGTVL